LILELLARVSILSDRIEITIGTDWISKAFASGPTAERPNIDTDTVTLVQAVQIKRRGVEMKMIVEGNTATNPDDKLIKAVSRAHAWWDMLWNGQATSIRDLAVKVGNNERYVAWVLTLRFLAPKIIAATILVCACAILAYAAEQPGPFLTTTISDIGRPYTIINAGCAFGNPSVFSDVQPRQIFESSVTNATERLVKAAKNMGGDAIVGMQASPVPVPIPGRAMGYSDRSGVMVCGTIVKFVQQKQ